MNITVIFPRVVEIVEELRDINDPADTFAAMAERLEDAVTHDYHDQCHSASWEPGCKWCHDKRGVAGWKSNAGLRQSSQEKVS